MNNPSENYMDTVTLCNLVGLSRERRLADWKKTKRAKNLLTSLSAALGVEKEGKPGSGALIEYEPGKRAWLHPNLIEFYKIYLSNHAPSTSEFLYLIKAEGTNYYKIGITSDKTRRLARLQSGSPFELKCIITKITEDVKTLEQLIHKELKTYHVRGEWFELSQSQLKVVIKTWFK